MVYKWVNGLDNGQYNEWYTNGLMAWTMDNTMNGAMDGTMGQWTDNKRENG